MSLPEFGLDGKVALVTGGRAVASVPPSQPCSRCPARA